MTTRDEQKLFIEFLLATVPNITVGGCGKALTAHKNYIENEKKRNAERRKKQKRKLL